MIPHPAYSGDYGVVNWLKAIVKDSHVRTFVNCGLVEDIQFKGRSANGLGVYVTKYLEDDTTQSHKVWRS
jgi:hypothetical protein